LGSGTTKYEIYEKDGGYRITFNASGQPNDTGGLDYDPSHRIEVLNKTYLRFHQFSLKRVSD
jgi:hypothetical protein